MTSVLELRSVKGTGGGPEKTILFGAERHNKSRFSIAVCYLRDLRDHVFGIDERAGRLNVTYVEVRERHSLDPGIWSQLVALAPRGRFDIIHGHDYKTNLLAWLLARRTGAIPIATSHGWTGHSARERWIYYPADRRVMRHMAHVIAVSSDIKHALIRARTDPANISVLLNGIDPAAFTRDLEKREIVRRQMGFLARHRVIGAVGRLEPQKRFDLLLEAFAGLDGRWPDARLVIAGDGSLRSRLETQARRLGISARCLFLGHRLDIAGLHDAFDLFVQSSDYEGTPNAVLEAMAMETPIVATDAGGTSELASPGVHGLIVPSGDVRALQSAIEATLGDPQSARQRADRARARVEHELSFAERTRRLEQIYDALMASRHDSTDVRVASAIDARSA